MRSMQPAPTAETRRRAPDLIARLVPDAITASVILTLLMAAVALVMGNSIARIADAYQQGLWMLLQFTMQMTLVIVLSAALSVTPHFRRGITSLAQLPRTPKQIVILTFLVSGAASYLFWGLGYALGPLIAILFAANAEKRGIAVDFPFLLGVTYAAQALWQYGLSSSGPLLIASHGHFLENTIGVVPLSTTIWSPAALIHEATYACAAILLACRLLPKQSRGVSKYPDAFALAQPITTQKESAEGLSFAQRLENSRVINIAMSLLMAGWLFTHYFVKRLGYDINTLNTTLLLLTFLLYGSVKLFAKAVEQSAGRSWAVLILYHLYAGVAGLVQFTNVGERVSAFAASISTTFTFPLITALAGTVFACFIPSSGGQFAVQGYVTVKSAMAVGVSMQRGILALGVGDHMGNFLTPFWYLVVAAIARVNFRIFFGYGFLFAGLWFVIGVLVFTFAPC
jgi:short-chain fatty acids transporter